MRLLAVLALVPLGWASNYCIPSGALRPTDQVRGALSEANCRLSDGTAFAEYTLFLPTPGRLELAAESAEFTVALRLRDSLGHRLDDGPEIRREVEHGEYVVLVNSTEPARFGPFSLRSTFTPEPNTICRVLRPIGVGQTVAGRWEERSCRLPNRNPYEAYALATFGTGALEVKLEGAESPGQLLLRSSEGRLLASGAGTLTATTAGGEDYMLVAAASDPDQRGEYRLSVTFTPADDETCRQQQTLEGSQTVQGTIREASCRLNADLRFQFYGLPITEAGSAEFRLSAPALTGALALVGPDGRVLTVDSESGGARLPILRSQLSPGKYTVLVIASRLGGEYTLDYRFSPQLPEICPALRLDEGVVVTGALSGTSSCRGRDMLEDVYRITLPSAGRLELAMYSGDFSSILILRNGKDDRLVESDGSFFEASQIVADLQPGAYSILAAGTRPGGYSIAYRFTPGVLPACTPQRLEVNFAFIAILGGRSSCRGTDGQPVDHYTFQTAAGGVVAAFMTSLDLDSHLSIQDDQGNVLRSDDNSFGNGDAMLIQFLPAQTYRLVARSAFGGEVGRYRVDLLFASGDRPPGCQPSRDVRVGDTITGALGFTSCQYRDDTFADLYRLELADASAVDVTLHSARFDAYLELLDSRGNVVELDDNSGGVADARLRVNLDAGVYYIAAKSFSGLGYAAGEYTMTVK